MANPGTRMRNRRVQLNMTLDEVAEQIHKSPQYLSALELNKNRPPAWDLLKQLVRLYGVPADYLLGITPAPEVSGDQTEILVGVFSNMSAKRQQDLLTIATALRQLDTRNENVDLPGDVDPRLIDLHERLKAAGRLDLLTDALAALFSQHQFDDAEFGVELGSKPKS